MRFSLIIPLYNKAAYIHEALESVFRQTKRPAELIIVDDASTDGSLDRVREFLEKHADNTAGTDVRIIELLRNAGPGNARNVGFEQATGDIVSFLDADDLLHPSYMEEVLHAVEKHGIDFLVMSIRYVPGGERDPDMYSLRNKTRILEGDLHLLLNPLDVVSSSGFVMGVGCNVAAKRSWMARERFHEEARLNEGIDYWYRVLNGMLTSGREVRAGLHAGALLSVRIVEGSLSRRSYRHWKEIDYPPLLLRYGNSRNPYDRRLASVIAGRWFRHVMQHTPSLWQKLHFMWHYRSFMKRYGWYLLSGKE